MRKRYRFYNRNGARWRNVKRIVWNENCWTHPLLRYCMPWFYVCLMQMRWMKDGTRIRNMGLRVAVNRVCECDKRTSKNRVRNVLWIRLLHRFGAFLSFARCHIWWVSEYVPRNQAESQSQFMRNRGLNCFFPFVRGWDKWNEEKSSSQHMEWNVIKLQLHTKGNE